MYPETLPLSLKVATLAPDNADFSSILIPALFLRKKEIFILFYFCFIFHILSFLFLRTLTIRNLHTPCPLSKRGKGTLRHTKKLRNTWQDAA